MKPQYPPQWRDVQRYVRILPEKQVKKNWQAWIADAWIEHGPPSLPIMLDINGVVQMRIVNREEPLPLPEPGENRGRQFSLMASGRKAG